MDTQPPKLSDLTTYCLKQYAQDSPKYKVKWSKRVAKQLTQIPKYLNEKFMAWVVVVERVGMHEARKCAGYHDEPLTGQRKGQRSIRLNRNYRAIYLETVTTSLIIVEVIEVNKHEY